MEAPKTKLEFYRRYQLGEFGNRPRTWGTLTELNSSDYFGPVTARSVIPGNPCFYCVTLGERSGYPDCRFNESMPDDRLLLQGEVERTPTGLALTWNDERINMRQAMRRPNVCYGVESVLRLRNALTPTSYDDLIELLDCYDGVVEFSSYEINVGCFSFRNTVFWEVRNY